MALPVKSCTDLISWNSTLIRNLSVSTKYQATRWFSTKKEWAIEGGIWGSKTESDETEKTDRTCWDEFVILAGNVTGKWRYSPEFLWWRLLLMYSVDRSLRTDCWTLTTITRYWRIRQLWMRLPDKMPFYAANDHRLLELEGLSLEYINRIQSKCRAICPKIPNGTLERKRKRKIMMKRALTNKIRPNMRGNFKGDAYSVMSAFNRILHTGVV